ncbi:hypothetical protein PCE1_000453 [Barthelona sp. PCE]
MQSYKKSIERDYYYHDRDIDRQKMEKSAVTTNWYATSTKRMLTSQANRLNSVIEQEKIANKRLTQRRSKLREMLMQEYTEMRAKLQDIGLDISADIPVIL